MALQTKKVIGSNKSAADLFEAARPRRLTIQIDGRVDANIDSLYDWTVPAVQLFSVKLANEVVAEQISIDNPPTQYLIDGSPGKQPSAMRRGIDVWFGTGVDSRPAMNLLMREAKTRMPQSTWGWIAKPGIGTNASKLKSSISGTGPVYLNFTDRLYLVQKTIRSIPDSTYSNILYKNGRGTDGRGRNANSRAKKTLGTGAQTTNAFRRNPAGRGFYVRSFQTIRYAKRVRNLPPGVQVGQRTNRISRFTKRSTYFQGAFYFLFMRTRGRPSRRRN